MIHFILGGHSSGKSTEIHKIIADKITSGAKKIILIVPEQSSFANERAMINLLGNKNCNQINVLSFSRLYDFVSHKLNIPAISPISEVTKNMLITAAINECSSNLKLYKKNIGNSDISEIMLNSIKEFKSNRITDETLTQIIERSENDILKQKTTEVQMILREYQKISAEKFKDSLDILNALQELIATNNVFADYEVFFDEFESFTLQQLGLIETILLQAKEVYITLACENSQSNLSVTDLFYTPGKTLSQLTRLIKSNHLETAESVILNDNESKNKCEELNFLCKNIFRHQKSKSDNAVKNISIYSALNVYDECNRVAINIKNTIKNYGLRYRDCAVITRNPEDYTDILKRTFAKYQIPFFDDNNESIVNRVLPNLILSAFNCIHSNYSFEYVLKYAKTKLLGISTDDISLLENYAFMWNISGNIWKNEFNMHPRGYVETLTEADEETLCNLNALRSKIITPLLNFQTSIFRTNGGALAKAIYSLLQSINAAENLKAFCQELSRLGEEKQAEKEAKAWDTTMEILSSAFEILGNKKINSKTFYEMFLSAIKSAEYNDIPQSMDSVIIGTAGKTKFYNTKAAFIVGASAGNFPAQPKNLSVFNAKEQEYIKSLGIEFGDNTETILAKEKFLAYTSVACPSDLLHISWAMSNIEGEALVPSEIIKETLEVYPNIKIYSRQNFAVQEALITEEPAFEMCAKNWLSPYPLITGLKDYFKHNEKYANTCKAIEKYVNKPVFNLKNKENCQKLLGKNLELSASKIENYHKCNLGYFCRHILKLQYIEKVNFNQLEYGNLMHYIFEKIFKKYPKNQLITTSPEELEKFTEQLIAEYVEKKSINNTALTGRIHYIINRLKETAMLYINKFVQEFKQSKFAPSSEELDIANSADVKPLKIELNNNATAEIAGKIDRVDIAEIDGKKYARIIDYKTGNTDFKSSHIVYGLNMQMLIYLHTLQKNGKNKYSGIIPAGALYFNTSSNAEKACTDGLILNDESVVYAMEESVQGVFIPVNIRKDKITASCLATLDELNVIFDYIEYLIKNMGNEMLEGKITTNPIQQTKTSCEYCKYHPICHYDENKFIKIPSGNNLRKTVEEIKNKRGEQQNGNKVD